MAAKSKASSESATSSPAGIHYQVLARRWRPQQFTDLVGQEAIAQALQGAITAERVAHAYLFTGARGVGKTSTARILAKALNCSSGPTRTPCGKCDACESIASGDDMDVIEIDGASNRGIDEVRELRQNANLRPTRSRYKIYIIDEVHMLTREAFNALLKTLEEPPAHVKFIFATTDPQKIPVTILSRCQRFDFGTISSERIEARLREIIAQEGIAVDDEVLELVTRRAAGSMRDSLSLLDQLLAFGGERVTAEQVHRLLGTASEDRLMQLTASLVEHNAAAAIEAVDQAEMQGVQLGELLDQLIEYFRDLMVAKSGGAKVRLVSVSKRQRERIVEQTAGLALDTIFAAADILAETKSRLRGSNYGRVLVDIALTRIASLEDLAPIGELIDRLAGAAAHNAPDARPARPSEPRVAVAPPPTVKKNDPVSDTGQPAGRLDASHSLDSHRAHLSTALSVPTPPQPVTASVVGPATAAGRTVGAASNSLDAASRESPSIREPADSPVVAPAPATIATTAVSVPRPLTTESAAQMLRELAADLGPLVRESITRAKLTLSPAGDSIVVEIDPLYNTAGRLRELEADLQRRVPGSLRIRLEIAVPAAAGPAQQAQRSTYTERLSEASREPLVAEAMQVFGARIVRVEPL
jgi:DNA polymerase-3 subunit gamma/tau